MKKWTVICGVILSLVALPVSALDPEIEELAKIVRYNCAEETKVDVVDINILDEINAGADLIPDEKLKCYILCIMEHSGMMSEGRVDVRAVIMLMPEDVRKKTGHNIIKCGTVKGADDCDTAYLTLMCWQEANRADYLVI